MDKAAAASLRVAFSLLDATALVVFLISLFGIFFSVVIRSCLSPIVDVGLSVLSYVEPAMATLVQRHVGTSLECEKVFSLLIYLTATYQAVHSVRYSFNYHVRPHVNCSPW